MATEKRTKQLFQSFVDDALAELKKNESSTALRDDCTDGVEAVRQATQDRHKLKTKAARDAMEQRQAQRDKKRNIKLP